MIILNRGRHAAYWFLASCLLAVTATLVGGDAMLTAAEFEVSVTGTDQDLQHVPIRVDVDLTADEAGSHVVSLSGDGYNIMGQLASPSVLDAVGDADRRQLVFVLPHLPAGKTIKLLGKTVATEESKHGFAFAGEANKYRELSVGGRPVFRYMHEPLDKSSEQRIGETYKVFHHVYNPAGDRLVTKGPGGLFAHHRGLFFGFNRITYGDNQKADTWHCRSGEHQAHKETLSEETGPVMGRHQLVIDWHGQDDKVFATETREMTAYQLPGGTLIEFATVLNSHVGKIELKGDPQHAGFQFRASQHVPDNTKDQTYYVRPDGKGEPGKFRNWSDKKNETEQNLAHINLAWNALSFVIDGQRYTCCYLDRPQNPKPARFSERDYGRFGSYFEYNVDTDKPLRLNYRIWLQNGEMTVDQVNAVSQSFLAQPQADATVIRPPVKAESGFELIFDGKSLDGWDGNPKFWRVAGGAITGQTTADARITNGNTFLIWEGGEVGDFELKLQYKITGKPKGNSGIQYRSFRLPDRKENKWRIGGYQADFETGDRYSGICYGEAFRGILADRGEQVELTREGGELKKNVTGSVGDSAEIGAQIKKNAWNDYHIIAKGNKFIHKINGVTTMELLDNDQQRRRADGLLALQLHTGPPMKVQFRAIQLKREPAKKKIVFVAGTRSHGYGSHEHYAGCLLLAKKLEAALPNYECVVHKNGYPAEGLKAFDGADAVIVYCDGGGRHLLNKHLDEFQQVMDRGTGLGCIHYGVEVPKGESGDAFLRWIGGYFETNWSVNPHWTAKYESFPEHPVTRGVQPFEINDEWYFHMRFRDEGVTPILSAVAPDSTMSRPDGAHSGNPHVRKAVAAKQSQHMAWVSENENGSRGFGFTGGHRHWNWGDDNFRKVVLNAIVWLAKGEVPAGGVGTATPSQEELEENQDFPKPKPKKKDAAAANGKSTQAAVQAIAATAEKKKPSQPVTKPRRGLTRLVAVEKPAEHAPEQAVANLDVHADLQAELFAAEPMLLSPANTDVDHLGRVWVCEIVNYRAHRNKRPEGDRILVLEDTDADGKADKQTVFYQGPEIDSPHGICVLGNRVIVSAAGKVYSFTDEDGDLKADKHEVMYSGIDGAQHDHGIHAFEFGPDGKLYFNFGNAGKQLLDADGQQVTDAAGNAVKDNRQPYQEGMVFRQNLDGSQLETLGWNFRNNWMVTVDSFGTIWQSDNDDDGNRGVRINFVMEFGNYGYKDELTGAGWRTERTNMATLPEQHWHQRDPGVVPNLLHTGAGSPTGITVYEGELLPQHFRGQLIHCDAGPSVTRAYITQDDGAGYKAEITNILEGTRDKWFRPSDVKVAPDGSLIVADWYDPGVGGHRMGDLDRGRIFRVTPAGHDGTYEVPKFDFETAAGAATALRNPNKAVRYLAWQALHKMGGDAESELLKLWNDERPLIRARALWLLGKISGKGLEYVDQASRDDDKNIRIVALRLARQLPDVDVLPVVARLVEDPSVAVRRECAIALRHNHGDEVAQLWAQLAKQHDGSDRWYLEALGIAADGQWDRFMAAYLGENADQPPADAGTRDLVWRSRAEKSANWLQAIIDDPTVTTDQLPRFIRALDFLPQQSRQQLVARLAFDSDAGGDAERLQYLRMQALNRLGASDIGDDAGRQQTLNSVLDQLQGTPDFIRFVSRFEQQDRYPALLALAQQQPGSSMGSSAMRTLLQREQVALLSDALRQADLEQAQQIIAAIGASGEHRGVGLLANLINGKRNHLDVRRAAVRAIAKIRSGADRLLKGVERDKLDPVLKDVAAAELNQVRWGDLRNKARKLMPLADSKDAEPLPDLPTLARQRGDAERGKQLFATVGTCANCHIVGGQGKEVGPNLSEIGDKLSRQALLESILYPSAGISHNYEAYNLVGTDGTQTVGLLTSQTDEQVVVTSDDGVARTFARADIDELSKRDTSLMPADLQKLLTKQELLDVVEYLTTLKK